MRHAQSERRAFFSIDWKEPPDDTDGEACEILGEETGERGRVWYVCSERLTTRREHRWTGAELRAAGKLQANAALTRGCHGVWYQRNRTGYKRMSRTCQNSFVDTSIDIRDGYDYLLHYRWTRRRHGLDQSILIRTCEDNKLPYRSSI